MRIACGNNAESAISWLCERPPDKTASASASSHGQKSAGESKASVDAQLQQMMDAAAKAKKDADHKEELRRINRAWNAKAEGEKRKIENDRRQKEVERLRQNSMKVQSLSPKARASGNPEFFFLIRNSEPKYSNIPFSTRICSSGTAVPAACSNGAALC